MIVRREFVRKLLARQTPPKGAAIFIANCLARDSYLLPSHNALATTAELLGVDTAEAVAKLVTDLPGNGDGHAQANPQGRVAQRDTQLDAPCWQRRIPLFGRRGKGVSTAGGVRA